jgi:hypothetical protein
MLIHFMIKQGVAKMIVGLTAQLNLFLVANIIIDSSKMLVKLFIRCYFFRFNFEISSKKLFNHHFNLIKVCLSHAICFPAYE